MKVSDNNYMFCKFVVSLLLVVLLCFSATAQESSKVDCYSTSVKGANRWVEKDVFYLITEDEKKEFLNLKTVEEKENFIEVFWRKRDPNPDTEANEFKEIYYERIAFANEHFASGIQGWKTDRGMVYVLYGKPDKIEKGRSNFEGLQNVLFERWTYEKPPDELPISEFIFLDPTEANEFRFENDKRGELLKTLKPSITLCISCSSSTQKKVVQLTPFGYITLPTGYWAYMNTDYHDAWSGIIEPLNSTFKIRFSDGIIESIFDREKKHIKWRKQLNVDNYTIVYALAIYKQTCILKVDYLTIILDA
jgi:GWxTD domain-containing protein